MASKGQNKDSNTPKKGEQGSGGGKSGGGGGQKKGGRSRDSDSGKPPKSK